MEDINIPQNQEEQVKRADYMRKELEQFPFIKNPIEQWSDGEKVTFLDWCAQFNNFPVSSILHAFRDKNRPQDNLIMKEIYGINEEKMSKDIKSGSFSEKYYTGTQADFYNNIKEAIINNANKC